MFLKRPRAMSPKIRQCRGDSECSRFNEEKSSSIGRTVRLVFKKLDSISPEKKLGLSLPIGPLKGSFRKSSTNMAKSFGDEDTALIQEDQINIQAHQSTKRFRVGPNFVKENSLTGGDTVSTIPFNTNRTPISFFKVLDYKTKNILNYQQQKQHELGHNHIDSYSKKQLNTSISKLLSPNQSLHKVSKESNQNLTGTDPLMRPILRPRGYSVSSICERQENTINSPSKVRFSNDVIVFRYRPTK